jgi:hypothetical protein
MHQRICSRRRIGPSPQAAARLYAICKGETEPKFVIAVPTLVADWGHSAPRPTLEEPMDKKLAGLLGAVASVAALGVAHAATQRPTAVSPLPAATSYAELLGPVGNATELLVADDAARMQQVDARIQVAADHHHHHHTKVIIKRRHHHHRKIIIKKPHHHHHSMYMPGAAKNA